jgi:Rod binding domain-containing protein
MDYSMNAMNSQVQMASANSSVPTIDKSVDDKALREQTDAFEAVIIKMLMDTAAQGEKNLFADQNDPGEKIYKSMYRDELSKASAGSFGFSEMLYDFLSR